MTTKKAATTPPAESKPKTSDATPFVLEAELARTRAALEELHLHGDPIKVKHSIEHCALMAKLWGLHSLLALGRGPSHSGYALQASKEAGEWEKRKATALEKKRVDLLEDIRERLAKQDRMASELAELDDLDE